MGRESREAAAARFANQMLAMRFGRPLWLEEFVIDVSDNGHSFAKAKCVFNTLSQPSSPFLANRNSIDHDLDLVCFFAA